jgi:hypothetical protein
LGRHIYSNGDVYEGRYRHNKKEGYGVMISQKGTRYEVQWRAGRKHGQGVIRHIDGSVKKTEWERDKEVTIMRRTVV